MEIPVINRMTDSLNNPSLITRLFSTFELGKLSHAHRFWKWGALFLAFVYAFSSLVNKIKILMLYFRNKSKSLLASSEPLLSHFDDAFLSDLDEDDDVCSTSGSSSDEDDDEEDETEGFINSSYEDLSRFDDDFNVKGSFCNFRESSGQKCKFNLRRRKSFVDNFSLSDFVNGNGVVKIWDGLDLGVVEVHDAFSFLDFNNSENVNFISSSIFGGVPAVSSSPAVFISAGSGEGKLGMDIWDFRTGGKSPAVHSEWRSDRRGKIIGFDSGQTGKVYVRDDVSVRLTAGDLRKVESPLKEKLTELEEDMWWDADGVSGLDESKNELGE